MGAALILRPFAIIMFNKQQSVAALCLFDFKHPGRERAGMIDDSECAMVIKSGFDPVDFEGAKRYALIRTTKQPRPEQPLARPGSSYYGPAARESLSP